MNYCKSPEQPPGQDLFKEVLLVSVGQRAAKLQAAKKFFHFSWVDPHACGPGLSLLQLDQP